MGGVAGKRGRGKEEGEEKKENFFVPQAVKYQYIQHYLAVSSYLCTLCTYLK